MAATRQGLPRQAPVTTAEQFISSPLWWLPHGRDPLRKCPQQSRSRHTLLSEIPCGCHAGRLLIMVGLPRTGALRQVVTPILIYQVALSRHPSWLPHSKLGEAWRLVGTYALVYVSHPLDWQATSIHAPYLGRFVLQGPYAAVTPSRTLRLWLLASPSEPGLCIFDIVPTPSRAAPSYRPRSRV